MFSPELLCLIVPVAVLRFTVPVILPVQLGTVCPSIKRLHGRLAVSINIFVLDIILGEFFAALSALYIGTPVRIMSAAVFAFGCPQMMADSLLHIAGNLFSTIRPGAPFSPVTGRGRIAARRFYVVCA